MAPEVEDPEDGWGAQDNPDVMNQVCKENKLGGGGLMLKD